MKKTKARKLGFQIEEGFRVSNERNLDLDSQKEKKRFVSI